MASFSVSHSEVLIANLNNHHHFPWWRYVSVSCHGSPYRGRYWSSKEYKDFSDSWGHHNSTSVSPLQVTSSECRFILITFPPIFIDQLLSFIEQSMCTYHSPITLIIWLITAHLVTARLVIPWLSTLELNKGVVYTWGGEGNGTPLQYTCLENPMDGGAW